MFYFQLALGDQYKTYREEKEKTIQEANIIQQNALEDLKQTDELKDEFLTITSHESQTPLNGIIGIAETMRDGVTGPLPDKMTEHLSMIIMSSRRLSHLINDIQEYSHLKNDQLKINRGPVHLYELTNVVLTLSQPLLQNKSIKLINEIDAHSQLFVYADESRVQQILYNLIGNAIKYTTEGSVTVSITEEGDFVKIHVEDTGKGFSKEQEPFTF